MKLVHDTSPEADVVPTARESQVLMGIVKATDHPVLGKRVLVSWQESSGQQEQWLPVLRDLAIREGDQVLLTRIANQQETVVTGVLDSLSQESPPAKSRGPSLQLAADESLRILGVDGTPLLDIETVEGKPQLRLLSEQSAIDLPGPFRLVADSIQLQARRGEMDLEASGDVKIRGEIIRAN